FQYTIKYTGRLKNVTEFENLVIRTGGDGQFLRLKDVAKVELGAMNYATSSTTNGKPAVGVAISQTAGSNAQEVIEGSLKVLEEASLLFPKRLQYTIMVNANDCLDASISPLITTLIE